MHRSAAGQDGPRTSPAPCVGARAPLVELVRAARAGDEAAWTALVGRFEPLLRGIARSYRLAPPDVDDVGQAVWMRLLQHLGGLRDPEALPGWLATSTRRECLRLLQRPVREELSDDPHLGDRPDGDDPAELVLAEERRRLLACALAALPARRRRLMTLLAQDPEQGYERIGTALGMPIGSIGPTRARCLIRLAADPGLRALRG